MNRDARSTTLPGAEGTLFGGYGPFVALVALVLAMALLAPTVAPERIVTSRSTVSGNRRSSATTGVAQERRSSGGAAAETDRRSSATTGVAQERRNAGSGGGAAGGGRP